MKLHSQTQKPFVVLYFRDCKSKAWAVQSNRERQKEKPHGFRRGAGMLFFNDYGLVCLEVNVAVGLCTDVVNLVSWYVCNHLPTIKQEPVLTGQLYMVAMQFVLTKWDVVSDRPSALVRVAHGTVGNIQNDGVKLFHGISFPPGVHRAVVVCCVHSSADLPGLPGGFGWWSIKHPCAVPDT